MKFHVLTVALFAVACGASSSGLPVATATTTGGLTNDPGGLEASQSLGHGPTRIVLGDDAVAQIASARCTLESACGRVGAERAFSTVDSCVSDVRATQRPQLTGTSCAKGVDPYALDRCLEEMRARGCNGAPASCASDRLCR